MSTTIHTFDDVSITNEGTLIVCDIDDTLLKYEKNLGYFYKILKHSFPEINDIETHASNLYASYVKDRKPSATDYDGFIRLMKKVLETKSKLIFITSRNECSKGYTEKEFSHIGICYSYFNVYYTNNEVSKGFFMEDKLDMDGIKDLIVIDDQISNLKSIKQRFPMAQCYHFKGT
jgi:hypothetical protein